MIGVRVSGHPRRAGLLLGLVLLTVAHLVGAVHGSAFEGPHLNAVADVAPVGVQETADSGRFTPHPGHHHHWDGHIDHAADRPRTASPDDTVPPSVPDGLALPQARVGTGGAAPRDPPGTNSPSPYGRSALALHCVWRQ
ncbi:hypothetical protein [Streptomyces sp. LUP47B]|uniref:hypothetical protein n=1 Tax=Streptomyces sp. LUP47B TaxID=1890286 RepID=UPI000851CB98|nr:hypothetical protein [Streptomyces sp. LUP47B]